MPTLPLADALAPDDFPTLPDDPVERRYRYLGRCRQVRVGPAVTVVFENRQTMWFRVQELAQVARAAPGQPQPELDWYSGLLPSPDRLHAAVWVAEPGRRPTRALDALRRAVARGGITLVADTGAEVPGTFRPDRVTDRLIGLAGWVEFRFTPADREEMADLRHTWRLVVEAEGYQEVSAPLAEEVRRSFLDDLRPRRST